MTDKNTKKADAKAEEVAAAEAVEESAKAAEAQDKADATKTDIEKLPEQGDKWFHDVDHDSNAARSAAQHARDVAAGTPDTRESNVKSRPGMRPS